MQDFIVTTHATTTRKYRVPAKSLTEAQDRVDEALENGDILDLEMEYIEEDDEEVIR